MTIFETPLFQVAQTHSFGFIDFQTLEDELLKIFRDRNMGAERHRHFSHFVYKLRLCFALPGSLSMQHLIDHDSNRPDIVLDRVNVPFEGLRRHVKRTAYVVAFFLALRTA